MIRSLVGGVARVADPEIAIRSETMLAAEAERVRGLLRRYLSPRVADAVLQERHAAQGPVQTTLGTILFCDLRRFTSFAEHTHPLEVARLLNEFLEQMTEVVFKYDGVLDKYTGDGLIAVFGVPYPQADHAERAVHTALEMQARHEQMQARWRAERRADLSLGIGIQSGEVLAGNFGSQQRVDYTVIGHAVNVAARLTAMAPGGHILLGEATMHLARALVEVESLGPAPMKNVSAPVQTYRLLGLRPGAGAFCMTCGAPLEASAANCGTCGAHRGALPAGVPRDGIITVSRLAKTLTSLHAPRGPHIIAVEGPHQGSDFTLSFPCAIGREALTNQVVLSLDSAVSRRHAVLRRNDSTGLIVMDLASQNGTFLNDEPIDVATVDNGDILTLGRTRLVVSGT